MKTVAMIPARYAATRFPAKLMQKLGDKSIIRHTYDNTVATGLFDEVWVVTDSEIIYNEVVSGGGNTVMSKRRHESGSDRIAEAVADMDVDVIVNVQGDEPFVKKEPLQRLVQLFEDPSVMVGSLMRALNDETEIQNPDYVKVVVNKKNYALYFSRSIIPYSRNKDVDIKHYLHIGIYAYRKVALQQFADWEKSSLENAEQLEQLRYLENGMSIKMAVVDFQNIAIDTPEDLEKAKQLV